MKVCIILLPLLGVCICFPTNDDKKLVEKRSVCGDSDCDDDCDGSNCNICSESTCCSTSSCNSCYKSCSTGCYSYRCRQNCVSNCVNRKSCSGKSCDQDQEIIEIETGNATQYNSANLTTHIFINNIVNNTNIIKTPVTVNNTNINNITLAGPPESEDDEASEETTSEPQPNFEFPMPCCFIWDTDHCTNESSTCESKRKKICSMMCLSPPNLQFPPIYPMTPMYPVAPPLYPVSPPLYQIPPPMPPIFTNPPVFQPPPILPQPILPPQQILPPRPCSLNTLYPWRSCGGGGCNTCSNQFSMRGYF